MTAINKNADVPIYEQLKEILKADIQRKRIGASERIPSENELAKRYGITRMTVRHAMRELQKEGWIFTKHGKGSYASSQSGSQMLIKLDGFSSEMIKQGFKVHSQFLGVKEVSFSRENEDAYSGLEQEKESPLIVVGRIRYLEGAPFAIEHSYLSFQVGQSLLLRSFDETFSMYRFLENEMHIKLAKADHVIEPQLANAHDAKLLGIERGTPVLFIAGTTFARSGEPIEYIEGIYLGDRYKLKIHIKK